MNYFSLSTIAILFSIPSSSNLYLLYFNGNIKLILTHYSISVKYMIEYYNQLNLIAII